MKLFRKAESYTVIVDDVSNFKVQHIADEVGLKGKEILILCLGDGKCLITFWTKEKRTDLFRRFDKEFRLICDVYAINNLVTVVTKRDCAY